MEAAKQHAGATINIAWEAGQLALLGLNIFGPGWGDFTVTELHHLNSDH